MILYFDKQNIISCIKIFCTTRKRTDLIDLYHNLGKGKKFSVRY